LMSQNSNQNHGESCEGVQAVARMHAGGQGIRSIRSSNSTDNDANENHHHHPLLSDFDNFDASTSTLDHLCLRIEPFDNEDEIRAYLELSGVRVLSSGLRKGAEGVGPSVYVADPEGNVVELKGPSSVAHQ